VKQLLSSLQKVGGALMLPIAVLPIAGLLLRLGQPDLLDIPSMAAAGDAIFANLGLLFAIGVAVGLARENHGAAGLASVVGYLVTTKGAEVLIGVPPDAVGGLTGQAHDLAVAAYKAHELSKLSVPAGILSGLTAGVLYNRFSDINLPSYLAFFGGRRFVPIASGFAGLVFAAAFGLEWQNLEQGMDALSRSVLHAGAAGLFAYGVLNRVLIITGLHHIINNIAWFLLGDYHGVTGDLKRFFAGDPSAGAFMSGFFPVMMFGLPAACLAMYHAARPDRRRAVGGLLGSIAFTSVLTGVTEPIEFTFIFLAPLLYAVHAVLTGLAFIIMNALGVHLGFGFSAGLFDYLLNFNRATRPLLLLPVGALYFGLYYGLFRFVIVRFDLKTPGRDASETPAQPSVKAAPGERARAYIAALGGAGNIVSVDACTTRLRLVVGDQGAVNVETLKQLGARGVVRPSPTALQVVVGAIADQVAGEIRAALHAAPPADVAVTTHAAAVVAIASEQTTSQSSGGALIAASQGARAPEEARIQGLLEALGGRSNVRTVEAASSRLRVGVAKASAIDAGAIRSLGLRGVAVPSALCVHVIVGPAAGEVCSSLRRLLA
jgi:N-acetylglucosamine PTS system EIICBA or EIICB component